MCRRWVSLALLSASSAVAQTPVVPSNDSLARLRQTWLAEMHELVPRWKSAERAAFVAESIWVTAIPGDTIRLGNMRWIVNVARQPRVPDALEQAWKHIDRTYGSETALLNRRLFATRTNYKSASDTTRKIIELTEIHGGGVSVSDRLPSDVSVEELTDRITMLVSGIVLQEGDTSVRAWLTTAYDPKPLAKSQVEQMYVSLVTAPSQVASRCLAGDVLRCRQSLGLIASSDPLTEWYDAPERRKLVTRMTDLLAGGSQRSEFRECVDNDAFRVCDRLLRSIPRYTPPPPLPPSARHHLFQIALQSGGAGAYARLVEGQSRTVEQRLASAARMPIDSLVMMWRSELLKAQPPAPTISMLSFWTTISWGVAVVLIALRFASWK